MLSYITFTTSCFGGITHILYYLIFHIICIPLLIDSATHSMVIMLLSLCILILRMSGDVVQPDIDDGFMDLALSSMSYSQIVICKYLVMCGMYLLINVACSLLIYLVYGISIQELLIYFICTSALIAYVCSISLLASCMCAYFRPDNSMQIVVMPFAIPILILSGLCISHPEQYGILWIIAGISTIIVPICLWSSTYLLKNIYNLGL